jgi:transcription initiation factor TFIIB
MKREYQLSSGKCPRCNKDAIITDAETNERVCSNCGLCTVIESAQYEIRERPFQGENSGPEISITKPGMGLPTTMDRRDKDASGANISDRSAMKRLRTWDSRSQALDPEDRNLKQAMIELKTFAEKIGAPPVAIERAAYIYRKALEKNMIRGRSITGMILGSLYAACRGLGIPKTLKDLAAVSTVKRKDIGRCYRLLLRDLELMMAVPTPEGYIPRIASRAGLSEPVKREAYGILKGAAEKGIPPGKAPMGLAGAALYVACLKMGVGRTQKDIAVAAEITEVTIRNRFKSLEQAGLVSPDPAA